jgi:hypothetical protein
MFVGESALATFEEHSLDDLFFRLDKGTFHVGESKAQDMSGGIQICTRQPVYWWPCFEPLHVLEMYSVSYWTPLWFPADSE